MDYFRRFTFLFAAPTFDADDLEGVRFNQIVEEIQRSGFEVIKARRIEDADDRGADRRGDRLHDGRLGQEGPRRQDRGADQPDAQAGPRTSRSSC